MPTEPVPRRPPRAPSREGSRNVPRVCRTHAVRPRPSGGHTLAGSPTGHLRDPNPQPVQTLATSPTGRSPGAMFAPVAHGRTARGWCTSGAHDRGKQRGTANNETSRSEPVSGHCRRSARCTRQNPANRPTHRHHSSAVRSGRSTPVLATRGAGRRPTCVPWAHAGACPGGRPSMATC